MKDIANFQRYCGYHQALDLDALFMGAAGDEPPAVDPPAEEQPEEQPEDPAGGNPEDG